jgi:predicted MFS family arabinose efflux permease
MQTQISRPSPEASPEPRLLPCRPPRQKTRRLKHASPCEIAAVYTGVMAVALYNVAPALAGVLHVSLGWNAQNIGAIVSADSLGMLAGNVLTAIAMRRASPRVITVAGMLVLLLSDLLSAASPSVPAMIAERVLGGMGGGLALATSMSVFAATHPERGIASFSIAQVLFAFLAITATPPLAAALGWRAVFVCLGLLVLPSFPLTQYLPATVQRAKASSSAPAEPIMSWIGIVAALSCLFFNIGQTSIWPYLEIIGLRSGIPQASVQASLSLSAAAGVLGAVVVVIVGTRFGRKLPLALTFALTVGALLTMNIPNPMMFRGSLGAFIFAWPVFGAYSFGVIASVTRSPRLIAVVTAATSAGVTLGPLLGGVISGPTGFGAALWLAVVMNTLSLACLIALIRHAANKKPLQFP